MRTPLFFEASLPNGATARLCRHCLCDVTRHDGVVCRAHGTRCTQTFTSNPRALGAGC